MSILIDFQPPTTSGDLWLDLNQKKLVPSGEQKNNPEFLRLDEILRAELTDADCQRLREWFFAEKLEIIETTPVSEIEVTDLPDANNGRMVGFIEIFPCGLSLNFTLENETWAADEQYCVKPDCTCKEMVLSSSCRMPWETSEHPSTTRRPSTTITVRKPAGRSPPVQRKVLAVTGCSRL